MVKLDLTLQYITFIFCRLHAIPDLWAGGVFVYFNVLCLWCAKFVKEYFLVRILSSETCGSFLWFIKTAVIKRITLPGHVCKFSPANRICRFFTTVNINDIYLLPIAAGAGNGIAHFCSFFIEECAT